MSRSNASYREFLDGWSRWADTRKFVFVPPGDARWTQSSPRLEGSPRGVSVEIDTYTTSNLKTPVTYTRARSQGQSPLEGDLRVNIAGTLTRMGDFLGLQRLLLNDPVFDARFTVGAVPVALAATILDGDTRSALVDLPLRHFSFSYRSGESTLSWVGLCCDAATLDAACSLVVASGVWRKDP